MPKKPNRPEVFATYQTDSEEMHVAFYPDNMGMSLIVTHNWCDGKHRPLTRSWRTKKLGQLGFKVLRWERTDWGEQAEFS